MRRAALAWYRLQWPREVVPDQAVQVCRLLATVGGEPIVMEAVGSPGLVEHRLALRPSRAGSVVVQLRAAIPGLSLEEIPERRALEASHAVELRLTTKRRPLRSDDMAGVSRAILTALAHLRPSEHLSLQWVLGRSLPPVAVPNHLQSLGRESWMGALLLAPFATPPPADVDVRNALRAKEAEPGWGAVGRLAVKAQTKAREQQLVRQLVGALGNAEAPGVSFYVRATSAKRVITAFSGWRQPLRLNVSELATVSAFPIGLTSDLPVHTVGSRPAAPSERFPGEDESSARPPFRAGSAAWR